MPKPKPKPEPKAPEPDWKAIAWERFGSLYPYQSCRGRYALLSCMRSRSVTLWKGMTEVFYAKSKLDSKGCGKGCAGDHLIVDLAKPE